MEYRFRGAGAHFSETLPTPIAGTRRAIATQTVLHEADVYVVVRGPMALEILQERCPIEWNAMFEEIRHRKREAMVDPNQRRTILGKHLFEPFRYFTTGPIFARAQVRWHLGRWRYPIRHLDT